MDVQNISKIVSVAAFSYGRWQMDLTHSIIERLAPSTWQTSREGLLGGDSPIV